MTYLQAFKDLYKENKKWICFCLTVCLTFSMLAFGNANLSRASEAITVTETVSTLGGEFGTLFAPVAQGYMSSVDTPTVLTVLCGISIALDHIPESTLIKIGDVIDVDGLERITEYSFGIIDYNLFRVLCLAWFVITKLLKSNRLTHTTAVILEDIETKIGAVVTVLVVATQFLANIAPKSTVQAASDALQAGTVIQNSFNAILCFVLLVSVLIFYFFVRYLFYFIDIILLPICSVVGLSSGGVELAKTMGIIGLLYLSVCHPYVFLVAIGLIFVVALVSFKKAYITIRYFKCIYVKPFFKRLVGFDRDIPLVWAKAPKKVRNFIGEEKPDILIPVYLVKKVPGIECTLKHDRWWFVATRERKYICKPCRGKNICYSIELQNAVTNKMFIKKSLRFFEVFHLAEGEENIGKLFRKVHKGLHFVFSMEYFYRFEEIKRLTGYMDYTLYSNQIKEDIKQAKKIDRKRGLFRKAGL